MKQAIFLLILLSLIVPGCSSKKNKPVASANPGLDLKDANKLLGQRRYPEAIQAYQRFLQKFPKDAATWNLIGLSYLGNRQPQEAISAFNQALTLSPTYSDVHNNLGVAYMELKNYPKASEEFRKALQDPQYPIAAPYFNLAKLAYLQNNFEESRALSKKVTELSPKEAGPRLLYAMSLEQLGRLDEALASYKSLLEISPSNLEACYHLGTVLMQKNQHCEAREYFNKVVDADPLGELGQKSIGALKTIQCRN